ncbi:hypothetical protein B0T21DRAFT_197932 [Apiosordaria backusii]|uniref:Uncharacterized protein n=1 Tax=Apiosordaria backusii TaxID=314023 RepID=A0AA40BE42_9PEZI|nr:hypothetical protein B0T21DRAFT_197932 [Apiosordaria backusii]
MAFVLSDGQSNLSRGGVSRSLYFSTSRFRATSLHRYIAISFNTSHAFRSRFCWRRDVIYRAYSGWRSCMVSARSRQMEATPMPFQAEYNPPPPSFDNQQHAYSYLPSKPHGRSRITHLLGHGAWFIRNVFSTAISLQSSSPIEHLGHSPWYLMSAHDAETRQPAAYIHTTQQACTKIQPNSSYCSHDSAPTHWLPLFLGSSCRRSPQNRWPRLGRIQGCHYQLQLHDQPVM